MIYGLKGKMNEIAILHKYRLYNNGHQGLLAIQVIKCFENWPLIVGRRLWKGGWVTEKKTQIQS